MPKDSGPPAPGGDAALRLLAEALVPHLRQHLKTDPDGYRGYYSQHDSPLGRTRHLGLARAGTLPGHKVGRRVLVQRDRVDEYIQAHPARCVVDPVDDADPLADWGLVPRRRR